MIHSTVVQRGVSCIISNVMNSDYEHQSDMTNPILQKCMKIVIFLTFLSFFLKLVLYERRNRVEYYAAVAMGIQRRAARGSGVVHDGKK